MRPLEASAYTPHPIEVRKYNNFLAPGLSNCRFGVGLAFFPIFLTFPLIIERILNYHGSG